MRKSYSVVAILLLLSVPSQGQFGFFGATEFTQILNKLQLIEAQITRGKMYADMVKQGWSVSEKDIPLSDLARDISAFKSALMYGNAIAAQASGSDAIFRQKFPGYQQRTNENYQAKYKRWSDIALHTATGVIKAAGEFHDQNSFEQKVLAKLRQTATGSEGRLQAIQAASALQAEVPSQLAKLRETLIANQTAQTVFMAQELQVTADRVANSAHFFNYFPMPEGNAKQVLK